MSRNLIKFLIINNVRVNDRILRYANNSRKLFLK